MPAMLQVPAVQYLFSNLNFTLQRGLNTSCLPSAGTVVANVESRPPMPSMPDVRYTALV